jgi:hypothetical protein
MQKLQALHRLLSGLANELEAEVARYNDVSNQIFAQALRQLQADEVVQADLNNYQWEMQLRPGIKINMEEDYLVVDCALLLYPDSGTKKVVVKALPTFRFELAEYLEQYQLVIIKNVYQEFIDKTVASRKGAPGASYQSLEEYIYFISLLQNSIIT